MRKAQVYKKGILAGIIKEYDDYFEFKYDNSFLISQHTAISLTMPKREESYTSEYLFPFFFNMLSEGVNRNVQLRQFQISENDYFGLLLSTSSIDNIGAITLKEIK